MENAEALLKQSYCENNFQIINFSNKTDRKRICYVFFSSNGLYKDRNDAEIIKQMHDNERYEWKFISENKKIKNNSLKIIFLRDIYKAFYIDGINREINTIEKIKDFLIRETSGMDVYICGSSAGAYMALLIGNMLPNTKRVLSLGGIVDLTDWNDFSEYFKNNLHRSSFKNISDYLYGNYWLINFYGLRNNYDIRNSELISLNANGERLINVGLDTDGHAPRPTGYDLIKLLVCSDAHLLKIKQKIIGKINISQSYFSYVNIGFIKTIFYKIKSKLVKIIRRK